MAKKKYSEVLKNKTEWGDWRFDHNWQFNPNKGEGALKAPNKQKKHRK